MGRSGSDRIHYIQVADAGIHWLNRNSSYSESFLNIKHKHKYISCINVVRISVYHIKQMCSGYVKAYVSLAPAAHKVMII